MVKIIITYNKDYYGSFSDDCWRVPGIEPPGLRSRQARRRMEIVGILFRFKDSAIFNGQTIEMQLDDESQAQLVATGFFERAKELGIDVETSQN